MAWLIKTAAFSAIFMAVFPLMESQLSQPPLCASQLALANHGCALLPLSPPPSPPSPPDDDDRRRHRSRNRRGDAHSHRHHRSRRERGEEEDCCRWIKEVDSKCVCDLLVRLPAFLSRAVHEYSVTVGASCNVTYSCPGKIKDINKVESVT